MNEQDVVIEIELQDLWRGEPRAAKLILHTLGDSKSCVLTEELAGHLIEVLQLFLAAKKSET